MEEDDDLASRPLPTGDLVNPDRLFAAAEQPWDAGTDVLKQLIAMPDYVRYIESVHRAEDAAIRKPIESVEWKPEPKPLMERIKDELEKREERKKGR